MSPLAIPSEGDSWNRCLSVYLGFIAGMVDVTGWLTLGGLFTAHITGNLVVIAASSVDGHSIRLAQWLAVPVFVVVAALIGLGVDWFTLASAGRVRLLFALQFLLLLIASIVAICTTPSLHPTGVYAGTVAMLAVAAMSSQNALLHLAFRRTPSPAVMTGNLMMGTLSLTTILLRDGDKVAARVQWRTTYPVVFSFVAGCAIGSAIVSVAADWAWLAVASLAGAAAIGLWGSAAQHSENAQSFASAPSGRDGGVQSTSPDRD